MSHADGIVITTNSQIIRDDAEWTNDASYLESPDTDVGVFEYAGPRGYANEIFAGGGAGIAGSVDGGAGSVNGGAGSVNGGAGSSDAESAESDAGSAGSDASKQSKTRCEASLGRTKAL